MPFVGLISLCCATASTAAEPLTDVLMDLVTAGESTARSMASSQAQTGNSPLYNSSTANETRTYEGLFVAATNDSKLAIFSDDGCKVTIDGETVLDRFQVGQHLPDLGQSFHVLSTTFQSGQSYSVHVEYSNTIHPGGWDIDGLTVFAFDGGGDAWTLNPDIDIDVNGDGAIDETDDPNEYQSPGVPIALNNLESVELSIDFPVGFDMTSYKVVIDVTSGEDFINIWDDAAKTTATDLAPHQYDADPASMNAFPSTVFVEATDVGSAMIQMRLLRPDGSEAATDVVAIASSSVQIIAPGGADVTNQVINGVWVGDAIGLTCQVTPPPLFGAKYLWTVAGSVVADWQANNQTGTLSPLTNAAKQARVITFHWVDRGNNLVVQVTAFSFFNRPIQTVSMSVNVDRPETPFGFAPPTINPVRVKVKTTSTTINQGAGGAGQKQLEFGSVLPNGSHVDGITFTADPTTAPMVPAPQGGYAWVQVGTIQVRADYANGTYREGNASGLDKVWPYATGSTTEDSPGIELFSDMRIAHMDVTFDMYLMWRHNQIGAIWVPLRKVPWNWEAKATSNDGINWTITVDNHTTQAMEDYLGVDTTLHPQWTLNANTQVNNQWAVLHNP